MGKLNNTINRIVPERMPCFAAGLYDRVARAAINTYYSRIADEITATVDSGNILDVGTGPGYLPIEIAKMAPNIDRPPIMIPLIKLELSSIELAG